MWRPMLLIYLNRIPPDLCHCHFVSYLIPNHIIYKDEVIALWI